VSINGQTYRFLFDTGAPNIISKELDQLLNPRQIGTLPTTDATGKKERLKVVSVASLHFGDVEFRDTATLVYELKGNSVFSCFNIDGFIGSNMLRKSIVQIDSRKKTIILTDKRKNLNLNKSDGSKIVLTKNQSNPYAWVQLKGNNKGREQLLIDTGADDLYDLSKNYYGFFQDKDIFEPLGKSEGASSVSLFGDAPVSMQYKLLLPTLVVNNYEINDVITETTDDDNSRIGAKILQYGVITIDYKGKRFYFEPHQNPQIDPYYDYGFSSTLIGAKISIGFVWDKDLKELLSYGDEIVAINGMGVTKDTLCAILSDKISTRTMPTIQLQIKNKEGEIRELSLEGTLIQASEKK
jgi:predicted aspartyl protease